MSMTVAGAAPPLAFTAQVRLLTQLLESRMQTICTGFDLTRGEFDVLSAIGTDATPVTPKVLLARLSVSPAGLSNRLYRLELKGLIRRTTTKDDKRRMPVVLTADGRDRLHAARQQCEDAEREVLSTVGTEVGDGIEHAVAKLGSDAALPLPSPSASARGPAGRTRAGPAAGHRVPADAVAGDRAGAGAAPVPAGGSGRVRPALGLGRQG